MKTKKPTKRKWYKDYLTVIIESQSGGKWVTDSFTADRRIALYGIGVAVSQNGSRAYLEPVIPCAGPLADLVKANPTCCTFKFNKAARVWCAWP